MASETLLETTGQYQFCRTLTKLWNVFCMINCTAIKYELLSNYQMGFHYTPLYSHCITK